MNDFATIQDLQKFWRTLDSTESDRAEALLGFTSNYLRQIAKNNGVDIDQKISDDSTGIYGKSVKLIILAAVKRAINTPIDVPPVDNWSQSASPYSETMQFTNPSGDIFFKHAELQLLGLASVAGKSKIGILRGAR